MTLPLGLAVALAAAALGGGAAEPVPVSGDPLTTTNGLRLLVADDPPFVLDVDSGKSTSVRGPVLSNVAVASVAGRAGLVVAGGDVFALRDRTVRLTRLGAARDAVPSGDGRTVWLKRESGRSCALEQVRLDGTKTGARSRVACGSPVQPGADLGIVAGRTRVVDPATGRVLYRARFGILAAAGEKLVLAGPGKSFTLVDVKTGSEEQLRWPSTLSFKDHRPAEDPQGRYVVLAFANPAWADDSGNTVGQVMDAWLLDTRTAQLTQVPGMPAFVGLKTTHMEWTSDGRLVILGEDDRSDFVAIWRPGQTRLSVKTVNLPKRIGFSDSFAPLR